MFFSHSSLGLQTTVKQSMQMKAARKLQKRQNPVQHPKEETWATSAEAPWTQPEAYASSTRTHSSRHLENGCKKQHTPSDPSFRALQFPGADSSGDFPEPETAGVILSNRHCKHVCHKYIFSFLKIHSHPWPPQCPAAINSAV